MGPKEDNSILEEDFVVVDPDNENSDEKLKKTVEELSKKNEVLPQQVGELSQQVGELSQQVGELSKKNEVLSQQVGEVKENSAKLNRNITYLHNRVEDQIVRENNSSDNLKTENEIQKKDTEYTHRINNTCAMTLGKNKITSTGPYITFSEGFQEQLTKLNGWSEMIKGTQDEKKKASLASNYLSCFEKLLEEYLYGTIINEKSETGEDERQAFTDMLARFSELLTQMLDLAIRNENAKIETYKEYDTQVNIHDITCPDPMNKSLEPDLFNKYQEFINLRRKKESLKAYSGLEGTVVLDNQQETIEDFTELQANLEAVLSPTKNSEKNERNEKDEDYFKKIGKSLASEIIIKLSNLASGIQYGDARQDIMSGIGSLITILPLGGLVQKAIAVDIFLENKDEKQTARRILREHFTGFLTEAITSLVVKLSEIFTTQMRFIQTNDQDNKFYIYLSNFILKALFDYTPDFFAKIDSADKATEYLFAMVLQYTADEGFLRKLEANITPDIEVNEKSYSFGDLFAIPAGLKKPSDAQQNDVLYTKPSNKENPLYICNAIKEFNITKLAPIKTAEEKRSKIKIALATVTTSGLAGGALGYFVASHSLIATVVTFAGVGIGTGATVGLLGGPLGVIVLSAVGLVAGLALAAIALGTVYAGVSAYNSFFSKSANMNNIDGNTPENQPISANASYSL